MPHLLRENAISPFLKTFEAVTALLECRENT